MTGTDKEKARQPDSGLCHVVYLGLGTNLGDRRHNLTTATAGIEKKIGAVLAISAVYETNPWGFTSKNAFLNAALMLETTLQPQEVLNAAQGIEQKMGRTPAIDSCYHDRIIDIDILLYDCRVINTPRLTIPHPLMHRRKFVLQPLAQIAPDITHPVLCKTMRELYEAIR